MPKREAVGGVLVVLRDRQGKVVFRLFTDPRQYPLDLGLLDPWVGTVVASPEEHALWTIGRGSVEPYRGWPVCVEVTQF